MKHIPIEIQRFMEHISAPDVFAALTSVQIMGSLRRKMLHEIWNASHADPSIRLTAEQLDEAVSSLKIEIAATLAEDEVEYLAEMLFKTYCAMRNSFVIQGFHNPALTAAKQLVSVSLQF